MNPDSAEVAIITVLPEEFSAICELLPDCARDPGSQERPNTFGWHLSRLKTSEHHHYTVVVAQAGHAGNQHGMMCTIRTIDRWRPRYVLLVGIAGGFDRDGLTLGDLVVSDVIWGYEYGKVSQKGFTPRLDLTGRIDLGLLTGILTYASRNPWANELENQLPHGGPRALKLLPGPIASGDKVVDNPDDAFFAAVRSAWPEIMAVEMEGSGAARAIELLHSEGRSVGFAMVRGISDMPGSSHDNAAVRREWKQFAAKAAAIFAVGYIKSGLPVPGSETPAQSAVTLHIPETVVSDSGSSIEEVRIIRALRSALLYITSTLNPDNGVPATRIGQESGIWTSASVLESLLRCPFTSLDSLNTLQRLAVFLVDSQLPKGGWPLVNSDVPSTMATGHAVAALALAQQMGIIAEADVRGAITSGESWLASHRNKDGLWGVEPASSADGKESRIISTYYALRPLMQGHAVVNTSTIASLSRLISHLMARRRDDGGWPYFSGDLVEDFSEVSNTSRVLQIILRADAVPAHKETVANAASFIVSSKFGPSWRLSVEGFFANSSNAQNVYHNNSPCDAIEALIRSDHWCEEGAIAVNWLIDTQLENGAWELRCPDSSHHDYYRATTWPTSEFIYVLSLVYERLFASHKHIN